MFLNISNTGTQINKEFEDYINREFINKNIYFNKIYVQVNDKFKEVSIIYNNSKILNNTICIYRESLNENIITWLENL